MTKKKSKPTVAEYVGAGYEVGYSISLRGDTHARFPEGTHLSTVRDGFWVNNDNLPAKVGEERFFIMPHMINYIRKDYRKVTR